MVNQPVINDMNEAGGAGNVAHFGGRDEFGAAEESPVEARPFESLSKCEVARELERVESRSDLLKVGYRRDEDQALDVKPGSSSECHRHRTPEGETNDGESQSAAVLLDIFEDGFDVPILLTIEAEATATIPVAAEVDDNDRMTQSFDEGREFLKGRVAAGAPEARQNHDRRISRLLMKVVPDFGTVE